MKWSISKEGGDFYLYINDNKACGLNGELTISSAGAGQTKDEVWFKCKGEKVGKRLLRQDYNLDGDGAKFRGTTNNVEFLKVIESLGVPVHRRSTKKRNVHSEDFAECVTDHDPVPETVTVPDGHKIIQSKCAGVFCIAISQLVRIENFCIRPINTSWVSAIKKDLLKTPSQPVTTIPVLLDSELCMSIDDFQADDNNSYIILGGNHLVSAMKLIMADQTSSDYECLGKVNAQVYVGLNDVEALYLSSLHNAKTKTLQLSFQDKVRVARRAYMKNEDSWKEEAVVSLGYIEGKTHTKAGLSTILSVACYSTNNYLLVEQVFNHFSDGSFPQMLFRNLQSVADDKRTPYLSKAVGTNGVKVSRIIVADKRRENLKILACQALNQQTWEDVEEHFFKSEEMLRYTGEISSPEGRGKYVTFVNKLSLNSDNCVIISITVNGIERTFDNEILGKKIKEIKTLVEKEILNEE